MSTDLVSGKVMLPRLKFVEATLRSSLTASPARSRQSVDGDTRRPRGGVKLGGECRWSSAQWSESTGGVVSDGLRIPMATELAWPNVMRPRVPLVYLDLFAIVRMARALRGHKDVEVGYLDLYVAAIRAKAEKRRIPAWLRAHVGDGQDRRPQAAAADLLMSSKRSLITSTSWVGPRWPKPSSKLASRRS